MNGTVVLITGASSEIGQSTARLLSQRGYKVFGTSRDPARMASVPGVEALPLDVRSDESVAACVEAVMRKGGTLHALVNSADFELAGAIEEVSRSPITTGGGSSHSRPYGNAKNMPMNQEPWLNAFSGSSKANRRGSDTA